MVSPDPAQKDTTYEFYMFSKVVSSMKKSQLLLFGYYSQPDSIKTVSPACLQEIVSVSGSGLQKKPLCAAFSEYKHLSGKRNIMV